MLDRPERSDPAMPMHLMLRVLPTVLPTVLARALAAAGLVLALPLTQAQDTASLLDNTPPARWSTGWAPEDPATYQALPPVPKFRAFLPPALDLSRWFPPVGNQGTQGSCTAWAVGYAARSYYLARDHGLDPRQAVNVTSPAYLFNRLRAGQCDQGTAISSALDLLRDTGAVPLTELPYNAQDCARLPSPVALQQHGPRFKVAGYRRVDGTNEDDIKGQLVQGHPVIIALDLPDAFMHYRGGVFDVTQRPPRRQGHALVITGYDDARRAFRFINSWSTHWGEQGYGWLSYRAAAALWEGGFVMNVPRPPAPPAPPPQPQPQPQPQPAPAPAPAPAPPAPAPTPAPVPPAIDVEAACGRVSAQTSPQPGGGYAVALRGFVGAQADLDRLVQAARSRPGVRAVSADGLALRPWPQCEALLTLDGALQRSRGASVRLVSARQGFPASATIPPDDQAEPELRRGQPFAVEVRSPDYPAYLYVVFLQADGQAVHLLRPDEAVPMPPNTLLRLGDLPNEPRLRVRQPFGHETVVLLATRQPLEDPRLQRPLQERQWLSMVRQALLARPAEDVGAALQMLRTTP